MVAQHSDKTDYFAFQQRIFKSILTLIESRRGCKSFSTGRKEARMTYLARFSKCPFSHGKQPCFFGGINR